MFEPSIRYPVEFNTPIAESYWRILQAFLLSFLFLFFYENEVVQFVILFIYSHMESNGKHFTQKRWLLKTARAFYFSLFFVNLAVIWQTLAGKSTRSTKARKGFIKRKEGFAGSWHSRRHSAGLQTKKSSSRCKNATSAQLHGHFGEKFGDATGLHVWSSSSKITWRPEVWLNGSCPWLQTSVLNQREAKSVPTSLTSK